MSGLPLEPLSTVLSLRSSSVKIEGASYRAEPPPTKEFVLSIVEIFIVTHILEISRNAARYSPTAISRKGIYYTEYMQKQIVKTL